MSYWPELPLNEMFCCLSTIPVCFKCRHTKPFNLNLYVMLQEPIMSGIRHAEDEESSLLPLNTSVKLKVLWAGDWCWAAHFE